VSGSRTGSRVLGLRIPGQRWLVGLSLCAMLAAGIICASGFLVVHLLYDGRHVSPADLPGVYRANYFDSTETLTIGADGTFHETFTYHDGASFQNEGRWRVETRHGRPDVLLDSAFGW
jgi:hypothetical protein